MNEEILNAVKKAITESKKRNFTDSVDVTVNLKDIDLSNPKNRINMEIQLPKGRGKPVKIGVFATGELAVKSKDIADIVLSPEDIDELAEDKKKTKKIAKEYDFFIAEAPLMPAIGKKLGVVLGPRGKMPKPVPPMAEPKQIIERLRKTVSVRSKDKKTFHFPVGVRTMSPEDITENIQYAITTITEHLEKGKGNIQSVYVKTSMGKAIRIM